jgi:vacuolar protein-sorting-associated protein 4
MLFLLYFNINIALATQAVTADDQGQREKAIAYYTASCEYFLSGRRYDQHHTRRNLILTRVLSFVARAEHLKLDLKTSLKSSSAPTTSTTSSTRSTTQRRQRASTTTSPTSTTTPDVGSTLFNDVIGLEAAKQSLVESVLLPQRQPQLFVGSRKPFNGILLYGPPGTGKTYLAKALANEAQSNFISISSSDIMSKHQGDSEKNIKRLFNKARQSSPCIIFIDEIDSIGRRRTANEKASLRRVKTELLAQMDGMKGSDDSKGVVVIGATNTPWELDTALRRRFQKRIYTPLPNDEERVRILHHCLEGETDLSLQDLRSLLKHHRSSTSFSASDMSNVARECMMGPVRHCIQATHFKAVPSSKSSSNSSSSNSSSLSHTKVTPCLPSDKGSFVVNIWSDSFDPRLLVAPKVNRMDVMAALHSVKSSVSPQDVAKCEEFGKLFGTGATNASVSASAAANANTSSSTGVLGFFGRLFGFGSTASTSEHLPVAPNTALPEQQQQRRMPLPSSSTGGGEGERKAVAM